jgi:hypothetical protein
VDQLKCSICGEVARWRWTDTHGVAQHVPCGAPHRIIHYEGKLRISKAPELLLKAEYIDRCRDFWKTTGRPMPGGHSFPGGYEMASAEDDAAFHSFLEKFTAGDTETKDAGL